MLSANGRTTIRWLTYIGVFLLVLAIIAGRVLLYISQERTFYWWDLANYQNIAYRTADQFQASPAKAFDAIRRSLGDDYNALFAIPLIPFLIVLGKSRSVYEVALALLYLLPFSLIMGAIASRMIVAASPRRVFWSAVAVTLLTPMTWAALLRGLPDVGAAALMGLAVWIYTGYIASRRLMLLLPVGCLIALAVLFRRHFAYIALAFMLAAVADRLLEIWTVMRHRRQPIKKQILHESLGLILVMLAAAATLLSLGRGFVDRVLTTDFAALYSSYIQPIGVMWNFFRMAFGWLAWLGAITGFILGYAQRTLTRAAVFIAIFGLTSAAVWLFIVRQTDLHYTLHFEPLIVLGLTALGWTIWLKTRGRFRVVALSLGGILVGLNVVTGLTSIAVIRQSVFADLFALQTAPLVSAAYDENISVLNYLREVVPNGKPIYMVASSSAWNNDLLVNAERALRGEVTLNFVNAPQVDSRDPYPLTALLRAQYAVVVEPFQHHMRIEEQTVLKVVYDLFVQPNSVIARDFIKLPVEFTYNDGISVEFYKRVQAASLETALATWQSIRAAMPNRPGGQLDWTYIGQTTAPIIAPEPDGSYSIRIHPVLPDGSARNTLLYLGGLSAMVNVSGTVKFIDNECQAVTLKFSTATSQPGQVMAEVPYRRSGASEFQFSFPRQDAQYLLLDVLSADPAHSLEACFVRANLQVSGRTW